MGAAPVHAWAECICWPFQGPHLPSSPCLCFTCISSATVWSLRFVSLLWPLKRHVYASTCIAEASAAQATVVLVWSPMPYRGVLRCCSFYWAQVLDNNDLFVQAGDKYLLSVFGTLHWGVAGCGKIAGRLCTVRLLSPR